MPRVLASDSWTYFRLRAMHDIISRLGLRQSSWDLSQQLRLPFIELRHGSSTWQV
jgi:hypothetical protein